MKKRAWCSVLVLLIVLLAAGCSPQSTPTPGPGGPQDGPQQGNPQQGGPDGGQPGNNVLQIDFGADVSTLQPGQCTNLHWSVQGGFQVRLDGAPVDPNGMRQVCPNATTTYRLEVDAGGRVDIREATIQVGGGNPPAPTQKPGGGGGPAATPTVTTGGGGGGITPAATATIPLLTVKTVIPLSFSDIALTKLFLDVNGTIMVQIKNTGTQTWNGNLTMKCAGDWRKCDVCAYDSAVTTQSLNLDVGDTVNVSTGLYDKPALSHQSVECALTSVTDDSDSGNNSVGPAQVK